MGQNLGAVVVTQAVNAAEVVWVAMSDYRGVDVLVAGPDLGQPLT